MREKQGKTMTATPCRRLSDLSTMERRALLVLVEGSNEPRAVAHAFDVAHQSVGLLAMMIRNTRKVAGVR